MPTPSDLTATLLELSARQHGLVANDQVLLAGGSPDTVRRLKSGGRWFP